MDGVLYHGETVLRGAVEFVARIADRPHVFVTNNPVLPPAQVADRLERLGFRRPRYLSGRSGRDAGQGLPGKLAWPI